MLRNAGVDAEDRGVSVNRLRRLCSRPLVCALLVGLCSLGVYVATMAPGLTWAHDSSDGADLATAAYVLGIAHPPGYPSYALLAHPFTRLPVGSIATRTNLFSACCAAAAVAVLAWGWVRKGRRWVSAASSAGVLALSPLLWSQAVVTEVHALNALFAALLLVAAWRAGQSGRRQAAICVGIGLLWGLSMGNSPTALFFLPLVLLALRRRRGWIWGALGTALGLSVYLYLPLRATANAALNWGDPRTVDRLWWMVSGALYRVYLFAIPPAAVGTRLLAWLGLLSEQFLGIGLAFVLLGAMNLWSSDRGFLVAGGSMVLLCSLFAIGYDTTDSYLYLLPAVVCLGLWLGVGLDSLLRTIRSRRPALYRAACLVAVLVPAVAMGVRWPEMSLRHDREAEQFLEDVLAQAPPRALFLSQHDAHTFSLRYAQVARGQRSDLVVVDLDLLGQDWYTGQLSTRLPQAALERVMSVPDQEQLSRELGRPVCQGVTLGTWSCWTGAGK